MILFKKKFEKTLNEKIKLNKELSKHNDKITDLQKEVSELKQMVKIMMGDEVRYDIKFDFDFLYNKYVTIYIYDKAKIYSFPLRELSYEIINRDSEEFYIDENGIAIYEVVDTNQIKYKFIIDYKNNKYIATSKYIGEDLVSD